MCSGFRVVKGDGTENIVANVGQMSRSFATFKFYQEPFK